MATTTRVGRIAREQDDADPSFERFAGLCGMLAGVIGFLYSISFVILRNGGLSALCLAAGALLGTAVLVALDERVQGAGPGFALWGLFLGLSGLAGVLMHAGFDLANVLHPPAAVNQDVPSPSDARGMFTFGVMGTSTLIMAWLIRRGEQFSASLRLLGYATGVVLILVYLARLVVLDAASPLVLVPAALAGFVLNPAWYVWLGRSLWRSSHPAVIAAA